MKSTVLGYGIGTSAVAVALLATLAVPPIRAESPTALFLVAVMVASWHGGLGPGLLATALSAWAIDYFVMPPAFAMAFGLGDLTRVAVFVLVALLINSMNARRRSLEEALRQRADGLAEADRRKDEFLAMLAHELRNPLAPIRSAVHALGHRDDDPAVTRARDVVERQVRHMTRLVDDLLDASRMTRGRIALRKEVVDLATCVAHAVETVRPLIDARGHELSLSLPSEAVRLSADPTRLEQVLGNLLHNAAKYTEPGGRITMAVERDGEAVVLRVLDTGIGIAPEMLPRIFDLFVQADRTRDGGLGGLGVGLSLVRNLVEQHGGTIRGLSAGPGRGSEFVVRLPMTSEEERAEESPGPPGRGVPGRRVLVVEDHVDSARSLAQLLASWGHEVRLARDGHEALAAVDGYRPEVVLLDIGLPGMDGREVARRLRERPGEDRPVLVALSGYAPDGDGLRGRCDEFDRHLVKPVEPDALRELLALPPSACGGRAHKDGPTIGRTTWRSTGHPMTQTEHSSS